MAAQNFVDVLLNRDFFHVTNACREINEQPNCFEISLALISAMCNAPAAGYNDNFQNRASWVLNELIKLWNGNDALIVAYGNLAFGRDRIRRLKQEDQTMQPGVNNAAFSRILQKIIDLKLPQY